MKKAVDYGKKRLFIRAILGWLCLDLNGIVGAVLLILHNEMSEDRTKLLLIAVGCGIFCGAFEVVCIKHLFERDAYTTTALWLDYGALLFLSVLLLIALWMQASTADAAAFTAVLVCELILAVIVNYKLTYSKYKKRKKKQDAKPEKFKNK